MKSGLKSRKIPTTSFSKTKSPGSIFPIFLSQRLPDLHHVGDDQNTEKECRHHFLRDEHLRACGAGKMSLEKRKKQDWHSSKGVGLF